MYTDLICMMRTKNTWARNNFEGVVSWCSLFGINFVLKLESRICFADSAMIMHVVPESTEVSSCGLGNISRTTYNVYSGARVTDVPYIKYI